MHTSIGDKRIFLYELCQSSEIEEVYKNADKFLNEFSDDYIERTYEKVYLNEFVILLISFIIALIAKHYKKIKEEAKELEKHCGHFIGIDKKKCIDELTRKMHEKQVHYIKQKMSLCNRTDNPKKCKTILKNKMYKIQKKIKL